MKTLAQYEKEGYVGTDAGLETSIFEYGLIWKLENNEYHFVYGVDRDERGNFCTFDTGWFKSDLDIEKEFNWIRESDWNRLFDYVGMNSEEWNKMPLPMKIYDLVSFYGHNNIFGSSYTAFTI